MVDGKGYCFGCSRHIVRIPGVDDAADVRLDSCECEREPAPGDLMQSVSEACGAEAHGSDDGCTVYVHRNRLDAASRALHRCGWDLGVRYNPHDSRNNIGESVMVVVIRRNTMTSELTVDRLGLDRD